MGKDVGRVPTAPGSREPSPSVSAASGFDPSREERAGAALMRVVGHPTDYIKHARERGWPIWHKAVADARKILAAADDREA